MKLSKILYFASLIGMIISATDGNAVVFSIWFIVSIISALTLKRQSK